MRRGAGALIPSPPCTQVFVKMLVSSLSQDSERSPPLPQMLRSAARVAAMKIAVNTSAQTKPLAQESTLSSPSHARSLTQTRRMQRSVFIDLLTYSDLELLKSRKGGSAPGQSAVKKTNNKRYLILTYAVEFDRYAEPHGRRAAAATAAADASRSLTRARGCSQRALSAAAELRGEPRAARLAAHDRASAQAAHSGARPKERRKRGVRQRDGLADRARLAQVAAVAREQESRARRSEHICHARAVRGASAAAAGEVRPRPCRAEGNSASPLREVGHRERPACKARTRKPRCSCAPPACCRRSPEQAEETRALWERIAEQEDATLVRPPAGRRRNCLQVRAGPGCARRAGLSSNRVRRRKLQRISGNSRSAAVSTRSWRLSWRRPSEPRLAALSCALPERRGCGTLVRPWPQRDPRPRVLPQQLGQARAREDRAAGERPCHPEEAARPGQEAPRESEESLCLSSGPRACESARPGAGAGAGAALISSCPPSPGAGLARAGELGLAEGRKLVHRPP